VHTGIHILVGKRIEQPFFREFIMEVDLQKWWYLGSYSKNKISAL
jgi:hypothetical protein